MIFMISVIMSTYREPLSYIKESTDSILNQTYKDIEFIIIIDDPENTDVIEYLKRVSDKDKRVVLLINERNCGLTESLNRAKRIARGDYIARMDADDISELDRLEAQLKYLLEQNYDLVGCSVRDINENGDYISDHITIRPKKDEACKDYLRTNSAALHPTWLLKREIYDSFDYVNFPACEDYEFLVRIALAKKKIGNIREPKLRYRINLNGISSSHKVIQKACLYYIRRDYCAGKVSSLDEFYSFLYSNEGISKQNALRDYYRKSEELKEYLRQNKKAKFFFVGMIDLIKSNEARNFIKTTIAERKLQMKYGDTY